MKMTYEEFRSRVVELATANLKHCTWFRGLNTSSIRESWDDESTVADAALQVELETAYWDRPGGLFGDEPGDGLGLRELSD